MREFDVLEREPRTLEKTVQPMEMEIQKGDIYIYIIVLSIEIEENLEEVNNRLNEWSPWRKGIEN
jgi:hypothetical protein